MSSHKRVMRRMPMTALTYAKGMWEALNTPRSLTCYLLAKYCEFDQLVRLKCDSTHYMSPNSFFLDYQATELVSKLPGLKTGIDVDKVAFKKFLQSEQQCRETNARFRECGYGGSNHREVRSVFDRAARKIAHILGPVPSLDKLDFAFGPGASYGVRKKTSVYQKVQADLECTYALADVLPDFLGEFPGWIREDTNSVRLERGNQLTFVPKNAKTSRVICIEPLLNGLYQKGVGAWIRDRLLRHGIDLRDQGVNQFLASFAQQWDLATVDFSSASDTVSYGLVLELLPIDWFEFLDVARCPNVEVDQQWFPVQKFSSMGNAYTFELETLIFFALATSVCEELGIPYKTGTNLSVYGDDVIIPQAAFDLYHEVSKVAGFTINVDKTFTSGAFYESCGHDYFDGCLVRPYLLTKQFSWIGDIYYAANNVVRFAERLSALPDQDPDVDTHGVLARLRGLHRYIVDRIPRRLRLTGPDGFGDGHLVTPIDFATLTRGPGEFVGWDGWWFRTMVQKAIVETCEHSPWGYALYGTRHQGPVAKPWFGHCESPPDTGDSFTVRGRTREKCETVFCPSEWRDISNTFWTGYFSKPSPMGFEAVNWIRKNPIDVKWEIIPFQVIDPIKEYERWHRQSVSQ